MVNKPKAKGTAAETRVVKELLAAGLDAYRAALKGNKDVGDVHIRGGHGCVMAVLEVKAGKQTRSVTRKLRQQWLDETTQEAINYGSVRGYLVIAKHGSNPKDYEVWDAEGHRFWWLDQFAEHAKGGY